MESFNHQLLLDPQEDSFLHEGLLDENEPGCYELGESLITIVEFIEPLIYLFLNQ